MPLQIEPVEKQDCSCRSTHNCVVIPNEGLGSMDVIDFANHINAICHEDVSEEAGDYYYYVRLAGETTQRRVDRDGLLAMMREMAGDSPE